MLCVLNCTCVCVCTVVAPHKCFFHLFSRELFSSSRSGSRIDNLWAHNFCVIYLFYVPGRAPAHYAYDNHMYEVTELLLSVYADLDGIHYL